MSQSIQEFYDEFASRFVRDYLEGNLRVAYQLQFFAGAIPARARSILVVGCGSGESSLFVARRAPRARILALDLSPKAIALARCLFPHRRIEYRAADFLTTKLRGSWEVILLPDVYEHVPLESRQQFARQVGDLLAEDGVVLLTLPTPEHQRALNESAPDRQVVDEVVTLADLIELSESLSATLISVRRISVWRPNDYMHAEIARADESLDPFRSGRSHKRAVAHYWFSLKRRLQRSPPARWRRARRVKAALKTLAGGESRGDGGGMIG